MKLCFEFENEKLALSYLFDEAKRKGLDALDKSRIFIFNGCAQHKGCNVGSFGFLTKKQLENRLYEIKWHNDSVAIFFKDEVFMPLVTNRKQSNNNVKVRFPTNETF